MSVVEAFKKTIEFTRVAKNHCLAKLIQIYGDLVTQIRGIQSEFPVDPVKGFQAFLKWQNHDKETTTRKDKWKPMEPKVIQLEVVKSEAYHDRIGSSGSLEDDADKTP